MFVFNEPRAMYGYEPGDVVSEEFARARPWAVREVQDPTPVKPPAKEKEGE